MAMDADRASDGAAAADAADGDVLASNTRPLIFGPFGTRPKTEAIPLGTHSSIMLLISIDRSVFVSGDPKFPRHPSTEPNAQPYLY
jgi:hypothetical protein